MFRRLPAFATGWISLVLGFGLAGCTATTTSVTSATVTVPPEAAFVQMPAGGPRVIDVIEHRLNGGVEQEIFLATAAATPGQNVLNVRFYGASNRLTASGSGRAHFKPLREEDITAEIRRTFPGLRAHRSPYFVQNTYGPFSYATAPGASDDLCLYAWQQIRAPDAERSPFQNFGVIQLRFRLCQARATPETLLSVVYGMTITGTAEARGWNPYGSAAAVDTRFGRGGTPIYPPSGHTGTQTAQTRPVTKKVKAEPAVADRGAVADIRPVRAVSTVTVPSPLQADAKNADHGKTPASGTAVNAVIVPLPHCDQPEAAGADCP